MSNYVKLAVIGMPTPSVPKETYGKDDVECMKALLGEYIEAVLPYHPDLIVLPEVCDLPQHVLEEPEYREDYLLRRGDIILDYFKDIAKKNGCHIAYNAWVTKEDGTLRNATRLIGRDGEVHGMYEKNHLTFGESNSGILPGADAATLECDFGPATGVTCFDLNFDEIRERCHRKKPKLVIFCSQFHGEMMRLAFAYETRAYLVGCCPGYYLSSSLISPLGEELERTDRRIFQSIIKTVNLDYAVVHRDGNEEKLRAAKAKYGAAVTVTVRDGLGACLIASESPDFTAEDILAEFGIAQIDDYLGGLATNLEDTADFWE